MRLQDPQSFQRAMLLLLAAFVLIGILFVGALAFGQTVVETIEVPPAPMPETPLGWVLKTALSVLFLGGAYVAFRVGAFFQEKAKQSKAWLLTNSLFTKAQIVAGKVVEQMRPKLDTALADGKVTVEERKMLQAEAVRIFREVAAHEIGMLGSIANVIGEGPVAHYLDGIVANALNATLGKEVAEPPSPKPA